MDTKTVTNNGKDSVPFFGVSFFSEVSIYSQRPTRLWKEWQVLCNKLLSRSTHVYILTSRHEPTLASVQSIAMWCWMTPRTYNERTRRWDVKWLLECKTWYERCPVIPSMACRRLVRRQHSQFRCLLIEHGSQYNSNLFRHESLVSSHVPRLFILAVSFTVFASLRFCVY